MVDLTTHLLWCV